MFWRSKSYEVLPALSVRGETLRRTLRRVTLAWMFGSVWMFGVGGATMLNFADLARFTEFHWGLMSALGFAATLAQLPASWLIERTGLRKLHFIWTLCIGRSIWLLVALMPLALWVLPAATVLWTTIILIFLSQTISNFSTPAWSTWMADLIPSRIRGRYFAVRRRWAIAAQLVASTSIGAVLYLAVPPSARMLLKDQLLSAADLPGLVWALCGIFLVAAVCGLMDGLLFRPVREVVCQSPPRRISLVQIVSEPLRNRRFVRFALAMAALTFGVTLGAPYYGLTCRKHLGLNDFWTNVALMVCGPVGGMLTSRYWGRLVDRWGRRPVLLLGAGLLVFEVWGWLVIPPARPWSFLVFLVTFYGGISWACNMIVQFNTLLSFTDEGGKSTYIAAHSLIVSLAGIAGGLIGGHLARLWSGWQWQVGPLVFVNYHLMFLLSGVVRAQSLLWLSGLTEPGTRPARQLIRQMSLSAYQQIATVIFLPARLIGMPPRPHARLDRDDDRPAK